MPLIPVEDYNQGLETWLSRYSACLHTQDSRFNPRLDITQVWHRPPAIPAGGSGVIGYSWLHGEFQAILGYMRPCFKTDTQNLTVKASPSIVLPPSWQTSGKLRDQLPYFPPPNLHAHMLAQLPSPVSSFRRCELQF